MKILITGGAGFIGSNLALTLQKQGHNLTIIDNLSSGDLENLKEYNGNLIKGDVSKKELFNKLKKERYDVIFHQASITETTYPDDEKMISDNVEGFKNILNFAQDCGAKLIYASSAAVYGNGRRPAKENQKLFPLNAYAVSKYKMDKIAIKKKFRNSNFDSNSNSKFRIKNLFKIKNLKRQSRCEPKVKQSDEVVARHEVPWQSHNVIGLRYFNVYGPGEKHKGKSSSMIWQLSQKIRKGEPLRIFKYGEQSRDHIYVKDVVAANIRAMESDAKGIFNVGTGKLTTFNRIIEILNKVLVTAAKPDYFDNPYNFYQNHTQADISLSSKILNWKSSFSIEDGIKDYLGLEI